jgi:hypothetical protein
MLDVEQQSSALTRARGFVYFVCFAGFVYNGLGGSLAQDNNPLKKDLGEDDV